MILEKIYKIILIVVAFFILTMNILGHLFWVTIMNSKPLLLFFSVTTLISQFVLWILLKNKVLLKIGFYYWFYVLGMYVGMIAYLYFYPYLVGGLVSKIYLFFRANTYWLFSTSDFLYIPSSAAQGGIVSKTIFSLSVFVSFMFLYGIKLRRSK